MKSAPLLALALFATMLLDTSCGSTECQLPEHRNDTVCALEDQVVDCTSANASTLTAQFGPLVQEVVRKFTGADGVIDWASLGEALKTFLVADGGCVLANVLTANQTPPPTSPEAAMAVRRAAKPDSGFEKFRAEKLKGAKLHTARGDL